MKQLCMRCYISGKVQGVWFRARSKEEAKRLGIRGFARNLEDGRVEVFACGDEAQLELFHLWLKRGPETAEVLNCSCEYKPWENYQGFDIF